MTTTISILIVSILFIMSWIFPGEGCDMSEDENKANKGELKLETMWSQQESFMNLLRQERGFPEFPVDISSKNGQKLLKDITHHMMDELFEASQHLKNGKSHRKTLVPDVDRDAYKEEIADALHLFFELVIASGITIDELYETYIEKGNTNVNRIKNGY